MNTKKLTSVCDALAGLLSLSGLYFSRELLWAHWSIRAGKGFSLAFCGSGGVSGCKAAALSSYSEPFFEIPAASLAVGYFAVSFLTAIFLLSRMRRDYPVIHRVLFITNLLGLVVSAFYLFIMYQVIGELCVTCLWVHGINAALLLTRLPNWTPAMQQLRVKTLKIATLVAGALAIILLSAFLINRFAAPAVTRKSPRFGVSPGDFTLPPDEHSSVILGNRGETLPMTMILDLACEFCKENLVNLKEAAIAEGVRVKLRIVLFPMDGHCNSRVYGEKFGSCTAAKISLCRMGQEGIEPFLLLVMTRQDQLLNSVEDTVHLTEPEASRRKALVDCVLSKETEGLLQKQIDLTENLRGFSNAVPSTWFNGWQILGVMPPSAWSKVLRNRSAAPAN
ncbi:MAG: hypothetical protein H7222_11115 [Methylotenera sp.]|nr:hypothetical protein [Oligoflexia bacterium]